MIVVACIRTGVKEMMKVFKYQAYFEGGKYVLIEEKYEKTTTKNYR